MRRIADGIVTIDNFLSHNDCDQFIELAEQEGYEEATVSFPGKPVMMKGTRNNDRVIFDSTDLAASLWPKLAPHLPSVYPNQEADSLNPRFRFYRYDPGQRFKRHIDGSVEVGPLASKVTFMIYLNEGFTGGETVFREKGAPPGSNEEFRIHPQEGLALLFEHRLWHEGAEVQEGRKYVLRSDVFYRREVAVG